MGYWNQLGRLHLLALGVLLGAPSPGTPSPGTPSPGNFAEAQQPTAAETLRLRGRVVWLAEALAVLGVRSVPEATERTLALQTEEGELVPILEDVRGRALRVDPRFRAMQIELLVTKLPKAPFVRIIGMYEITAAGPLELDYWCDICAIAMYEQKPCDCCQGPTELRKRKVAARQPAAK